MDPQYLTDVLCNYLWKTRRPLYTNTPIIYENVHTLLKQGASRSLTWYDMRIPPVLVALFHLHEPKLVKLLMDDTFDRNIKVPYMHMVWDYIETCDIGVYRYYSIENIILMHYHEANYTPGLLEDKLVEIYHKVVPVTPCYKVYPETESDTSSDRSRNDDGFVYNYMKEDNNEDTNDNTENTKDTTNDIIEYIDLDIDYDIEYYYKSDKYTDSDTETSDESDKKSELLYNFYRGKCTVPEKETRDISDCSSNETPNKKRLIAYNELTYKNKNKYTPRLKDLHYSSYIMNRIEEYCLMFNVDFKSLETREEDVSDDVSKDPFE